MLTSPNMTGDKWLYYKLYCGVRISDSLLTDLVLPLVIKLTTESLIEKWFFIRYSDPENHIRLRLKVKNKKNIDEIVKYFNHLASAFINHNQLWKILQDTYVPETDRYGKKTIEFAESLFFYDSEMIIKFIDNNQKYSSEDRIWMFAILAINCMLDDFSYTLRQKEYILDTLNKSYKIEFNIDRKLKAQLDLKYRKYSENIEQMINDPDSFKIIGELPLKLLRTRSVNQSDIINKLLNYKKNKNLEVDFTELISSFIHMMVNRLFRSRQRIHELVLYDFLSRFYKSKIAREKYSTNSF